MTNYSIRIEVPEGEVSEILAELQEAQEQIGRCYNRLQLLGVITVVKEKEPPAGADGQA